MVSESGLMTQKISLHISDNLCIVTRRVSRKISTNHDTCTNIDIVIHMNEN